MEKWRVNMQELAIGLEATGKLKPGETLLISDIVKRGCALAAKFDCTLNPLNSFLDMIVVHRALPLNLKGMLESDDFNFAHDFFGIRNHLDRISGKLGNCFLPRFTLPYKDRLL